jgi:hypothetical protein
MGDGKNEYERERHSYRMAHIAYRIQTANDEKQHFKTRYTKYERRNTASQGEDKFGILFST